MKDRAAVKIGLVLPKSNFGDEEWKNAEQALRYVDEADREGVQFLGFPEGYPGPATGPLEQEQLSYKPIDALREKAKEKGIYISAGDVEPNPDLPETYFLTLKLISPKGEILARYLRVQPDTPPLNAYLYNGKAHLLPGRNITVVPTSLGNFGLEICSELWVPEISRILMLRGAEIVFAPVHGIHSETMHKGGQLADTWKCIARARAAENDVYVMVTQNIYQIKGFSYSRSSTTGAFIAGPEKMIAVRDEPGLLTATLDMSRIDYIRSRNYDEEILSKPEGSYEPLGCRPGQIWERNPKLFSDLVRPSKYSLDYFYFRRNLDNWIDQYDKRIYGGKYQKIQQKYGKLVFKE